MEVLLLWILGPVLIKFSQCMAADPQLEPVDLASVPPLAAQYLLTCQQALEAEGFTTVGHLSWANAAPNVFPLITLFMNRTTNVKALATVFYTGSAEGAKLTASYVEFITRYGNGDVLQTSNNKSFGTSKHGPEQKTLRVLDMENPHEIYAFHCRRMAQRHGEAIEPLPASGTEVTVQQERMTEDYEAQVKFKRLYLDRKAEMYRFTWIGAYLATWSQLQPMKELRRAEECRKTAAALKELDPLPGTSRVY